MYIGINIQTYLYAAMHGKSTTVIEDMDCIVMHRIIVYTEFKYDLQSIPFSS